MPLTEFQARLARLLSRNRSFDSYLAGGSDSSIPAMNRTRFPTSAGREAYYHGSPMTAPELLKELSRVAEIKSGAGPKRIGSPVVKTETPQGDNR